MPQNKKRPVTYGKSPLNRLEPYMPGPDKPTKPSGCRTSRGDASLAATAYPAVTPTSLAQPPRSTENPEPACLSPIQVLGEHSDTQRKRRRLSPGKNQHTRYGNYINLPAPLGAISVDRDMDDDVYYFSNTSPKKCGQDSSEALRTPLFRKPCEAITVDQAQSSLWRPVGRQKPISRPRDHDKRDPEDPLESLPTGDSAVTRTRLVDSLGTRVAESRRALKTKLGDAPSPSQHLHGDQPALTRAPADYQGSQQSPGAGTLHIDRLQDGPKSPKARAMLPSPRVTYSRQRSFLHDSSGIINAETDTEGDFTARRSRKDAYNVLDSRLVSEDDPGDSKPVRSIHELRQAGNNARFREIVDSIFEDIEGTHNSTSGRCRSLAELCGKLLDPDFAHRFSEQGFGERLVDCFSKSLDLVSASLALGAYKLIITGGHASRVFSESLWTKIHDLPSMLLDARDDILTLALDASMGLSKTAQASIRAIHSHLLPSMDSSWPRLSPRLLALGCTKSSLLALREGDHSLRPISATFLNKLVDLTVDNTPKDLDAPLSKDRFQYLDLVLSILENYSVILDSFDSDHRQYLRRLSQLHRLLSPAHHSHNRQIRLAYIRVTLNLTNKELTLCDSFAIPEFVSGLVKIVTGELRGISETPQGKENSALTAVILALGTLINLTEKTQQSRAILMHPDRRTGTLFNQLLDRFSCSVISMDQAKSVHEVHENVVAGYLSILLLTVCLDEQALTQFECSQKSGGLALVLATAEQFLQYHREIEKDNLKLESWQQEDHRLTARLEHIINQTVN
ncbi:wings apart-like protein regulation of heterochromatin-domain-containing protein [Aspergillus crustosus]